ncbi:hypothetical protein HKX48_000193 [Thoreauomyces humboldtii]|nr:hypothetical protein HKX48_000193 [Thoreauomyces humboldtii]
MEDMEDREGTDLLPSYQCLQRHDSQAFGALSTDLHDLHDDGADHVEHTHDHVDEDEDEDVDDGVRDGDEDEDHGENDDGARGPADDSHTSKGMADLCHRQSGRNACMVEHSVRRRYHHRHAHERQRRGETVRTARKVDGSFGVDDHVDGSTDVTHDAFPSYIPSTTTNASTTTLTPTIPPPAEHQPGQQQPQEQDDPSTTIPATDPPTFKPPRPKHSYSDPVLLGTRVSSCHILRDEDGTKGLYFAFPDMGVRASGIYRLRFHLFVVGKDGLGMR